ncbi:MAG: hypothetical protein ACOX9C_06165 [Kiritimatiellia bacterium]|jgi:hypothetical protein
MIRVFRIAIVVLMLMNNANARQLFPSAATEFKARPGTQARLASNGWLEVTCDGSYGWPGVEFSPQDGATWDLASAGVVEIVVRNMGSRSELISAGVFPKGAARDLVLLRSSLVPPGECRLVSIQLADVRTVTDLPVTLEGVQGEVGCVGKNPLDYSETVRIEVFQCQPEEPHPLHFAVLGVRTAFKAVKPKVVPAADFFPFCDRYGQFKHAEWPGKIHSDDELIQSHRREEAWLNANGNGPVPNIGKYGGWKGGPRLKATGFFRTEKVDDHWWLVDPEGHLFFSLGITCVYASTDTIVDGREKYFEWLPDKLDDCWNDPTKKSINFMKLNQIRKYGQDWIPRFADTAHRRFRAWGINTIANWSPEFTWGLRRTPYVATIDFSSRTRLKTEKQRQFGRRMPDVYSPQFVEDLRVQLEALAQKIKDDPWCLGVFVDNELGWTSVDNPAEVAEKYFSIVSAEVKTALPNHLYLGCRFAWGGEEVWRAASRHCDVVSFNFYERQPSKDLPAGSVDKPLIVGEFHFGALDRGPINSGCVRTFDQNERAQCFQGYVNACLDHPRFVGCHWFQYSDQALTGRNNDGESYQCGFVSVCDVPYPELVKACRETAAKMYPRRLAAGKSRRSAPRP